jgi:glutathionylspermidine synthase
MIPFHASDRLPEKLFREIRLRTIFECFKWDPQVEDSSVLAPFAVHLKKSAWIELARLAEQLAAETITAEARILADQNLLTELKLPRKIEKAIRSSTHGSETPRVMRFDFHFTTEGWRISEVNSDVPGGFIEAQGFTQLMSEALGAAPTGQPATAVAKELLARANIAQPNVAFIHASAYSDDRQVMLFLAREVENHGARAVLLDPSQVSWSDEGPRARCEWFNGPLHSMFRFFPAEWLPNLRRTCGWENFFANRRVPQCNPGAALISQTKRFGILARMMADALPTWNALLPETRDVRGIETRSVDWVFKPALGRVGEDIGISGITPAKELNAIRRDLFFAPGAWVAQRRFEMIPLPTPLGPQYLCLGVYTVNGAAAGIYARGSSSPIIHHTARDVAVLLEKESC